MADMFLKLEGIMGESLDYQHQNHIEVHGWTWGLSNNASLNMKNKDDGTPHTTVALLSIDKVLDGASVSLVQYCAQGTHIDKACLACRKNTGDRGQVTDYLIIELTDVKVHSVNWPGKAAETGGLVGETVEFQFGKFEITYRKEAQEGQLYGAMSFPFDVPEQKMT